MAKRIANVIVTVLLTIPVFSLISAVLHLDRLFFDQGYSLALSADAEDQDDTDPVEDNECDQDEMELHNYYPLVVPGPVLKQIQSRQELLFKETHLEVITPPPKI